MSRQRLRIGIYNRYLHTIGGGEKYMGVMAEILSRDHDAQVLTYWPVRKQSVEKRLNVDWSQVRIRMIPDSPNTYTAGRTADYDVFVNASYMSALPSQARRSYILVYFPTPFDRYLTRAQKAGIRLLGPAVKRVRSRGPIYAEGFYGRERFFYVAHRWTDGAGKMLIPPPPNSNHKELEVCLGGYRKPPVSKARVRLYLNGKAVSEELTLPRHRFVSQVVTVPKELDPSEQLTLGVVSDTFVPADAGLSDDIRKLGVSVAYVRWGRSLDHYLYRLTDFGPEVLETFPKSLAFLDSYDQVISISEYTQSWVKRLWGRDSVILYPPVDTEEFKTAEEKKNIILSVGRFFDGRYNKKQLPMIDAFKRLCDEGLSGWEYHLVGGTHKEPMHQHYLAKARRACRGYPIFIHTDISFDAIKKFYAKAKIFWHASGYGEDDEKHPEAFEHFGITTVEAMSAGCVPIVINKAGQKEIVQDGENGFHWDTIDDLRNETFGVVRDESLREKIAANAVARSQDFSRERFETRLWEILIP